MRVDCASFSHLGPRESNQDRFLAPVEGNHPFLIAAIADGIGGAPGGEEAASLAVELASQASTDPQKLPELFANIVNAMRNIAKTTPELERMGTTLTVGLLADLQIHIAHVGDTRAYHLRGAGLNSLTEDQTEVAELLRKGILRENQARRYPRRNVLLSALTVESTYQIFRSSALLKVGDRLLFLTDGAYRRVARGAILNASLETDDLSGFVQRLEKLTTEAEPSDNFTALALQVLE